MKISKQSVSRFNIVIGATMVIIGCITLLYIMNVRDYNAVANSEPPISIPIPAQPLKPSIEGEPDQLLIPSLNYNLPVIPGYYYPKSKTWTLTLNEVQYATVTPEPNNLDGNTFFYGHYRLQVFALLHLIKLGAQAVVNTTNGHTFYYTLVSERTVTPEDNSVFDYSGPPILTIQTCTGLFFQNRQFFVFDLEKVT